MTQEGRKHRQERGIKVLPPDKYGRTRVQASWWFEGRWIRRRFRTVTEAKQCLTAVRGQIVEGRYMDRRKEGKTRFEEAVTRFLEWSEVNTRPGSHERDVWASRQWLIHPAFTGHALNEITGGEVERFKHTLLNVVKKPRGKLRRLPNGAWVCSWCKAGQYHRHVAKSEEEARKTLEEAIGKNEGRTISRRSVDICVARLKRLFNLCVEWELLTHNPAQRVKLFREDRRRTRYLSEDEERRLFEACSPELGRVVVFALHTGMRRGEILGLRWEDVDFRNAVAVIPAGRAKGKRNRFVPLNAVALAVLDTLVRPLDRSALVFSNHNGGEWDRLRKHWEKAVTVAGLEDFRFHDLRHTYASRAVMAGVDLAVLRELLGHRDFETTLRYSHLAPSKLTEAVATLARLYPAPAPSERPDYQFSLKGGETLPLAAGAHSSEPLQ